MRAVGAVTGQWTTLPVACSMAPPAEQHASKQIRDCAATHTPAM
jgi:hypothetical protein